MSFDTNTSTHNRITVCLDQELVYDGPANNELNISINNLTQPIENSAYTLTISHNFTKPIHLSDKSKINFWNENEIWTNYKKNCLRDYFYLGACKALGFTPKEDQVLSDRGKQVIDSIINYLKMKNTISYPKINLPSGANYWIQPFTPNHYTTLGCGFNAVIQSKSCISAKLFINQKRTIKSLLYPNKPNLIHSRENIFHSLNLFRIELNAPRNFTIQFENLDSSHFSQKVGFSIENYLQLLHANTIFISTPIKDTNTAYRLAEWIGKKLYIPDEVNLIYSSKLKDNEWLIATSENQTNYLISRLNQRKKMFSRKYHDVNEFNLVDLMSYPKGVGLFGRISGLTPLPEPNSSNGAVSDLIYCNDAWQDLYVWTESSQRKKFIKNQSFFWKNSRFYVIVILIMMITSILLFFKKNLNQGQP